MYQALRHNTLVLVLNPEKSIKLLLIIFAFFFSLLPTLTTTTTTATKKNITKHPEGAPGKGEREEAVSNLAGSVDVFLSPGEYSSSSPQLDPLVDEHGDIWESLILSHLCTLCCIFSIFLISHIYSYRTDDKGHKSTEGLSDLFLTFCFFSCG